MRIEAHLLARGTAEELVHRLSERFAFDIPQSHVDGTNGGHHICSTTKQATAEHVLPVPFDRLRIFADEVFGAVLDACYRHERGPAGSAGRVQFANPGDTLICLHLDVNEAMDANGLHTADSHTCLLAPYSNRSPGATSKP